MALKIVVVLKAVDGCFTGRISLNIDWFVLYMYYYTMLY